jgi:hypothetical protein
MTATDTVLVLKCISEYAARPKRNKGVDVKGPANCIKVPAMIRQVVWHKDLSPTQ